MSVDICTSCLQVLVWFLGPRSRTFVNIFGARGVSVTKFYEPALTPSDFVENSSLRESYFSREGRRFNVWKLNSKCHCVKWLKFRNKRRNIVSIAAGPMAPVKITHSKSRFVEAKHANEKINKNSEQQPSLQSPYALRIFRRWKLANIQMAAGKLPVHGAVSR